MLLLLPPLVVVPQSGPVAGRGEATVHAEMMGMEAGERGTQRVCLYVSLYLLDAEV